MNFLKTIFLLAYVVTAGYGFLRLFFKEKPPFSIFGQLPISFIAGLGLLGFWGNLLMLVRLKLSFWPLALFLLPFFVFGIFKLWR